jgi:hypothetical protein
MAMRPAVRLSVLCSVEHWALQWMRRTPRKLVVLKSESMRGTTKEPPHGNRKLRDIDVPRPPVWKVVDITCVEFE